MDPAGGKYVTYRSPHVPADGGVNLLAWSGDGKRAMLEVARSPKSMVSSAGALLQGQRKVVRVGPGA